VLIFGVVNAVLFGTGLVRHSRIYPGTSHPWWVRHQRGADAGAARHLLLLAAPADGGALFRAGLLHHRSIHPTAYAAYASARPEALARR
jgi:hypothetical protein